MGAHVALGPKSIPQEVATEPRERSRRKVSIALQGKLNLSELSVPHERV